ncbi:hypothetical protein B0I35DRAFT_236977 [Stachybotrys elegans]|uniref:Uncharacterized protein n=1 Tax=Stachybotrys elegans TaxID=80388 RepID=A0A8K0SUC4_9HYPO|nr:hypothetical protein B0I35DRAFT_236977 [Stachybotrys elegans]
MSTLADARLPLVARYTELDLLGLSSLIALCCGCNYVRVRKARTRGGRGSCSCKPRFDTRGEPAQLAWGIISTTLPFSVRPAGRFLIAMLLDHSFPGLVRLRAMLLHILALAIMAPGRREADTTCTDNAPSSEMRLENIIPPLTHSVLSLQWLQGRRILIGNLRGGEKGGGGWDTCWDPGQPVSPPVIARAPRPDSAAHCEIWSQSGKIGQSCWVDPGRYVIQLAHPSGEVVFSLRHENNGTASLDSARPPRPGSQG